MVNSQLEDKEAKTLQVQVANPKWKDKAAQTPAAKAVSLNQKKMVAKVVSLHKMVKTQMPIHKSCLHNNNLSKILS